MIEKYRATATPLFVSLLIGSLLITTATPLAQAQESEEGLTVVAEGQDADSKKPSQQGSFNVELGEESTFISSDTLTLQSEKRVFTYSGNVQVSQGDFILTSDTVDGFYDEKNDIQRLEASGGVVITKGLDIRASSNKAIYEKATETVTLTENPELLQEDNVLSADSIVIYLLEDRSVAQGEVRVKLPRKGDESEQQKKELF